MDRNIRWGVIGCGGIAARRTIPEMIRDCPGLELAWVMDTDAARAKQVAKQFHVPHVSISETELLAADLDAVYIATPPQFHSKQVVAAARAGKHVLCEKPIALSLSEVDEIDKACQQNDVLFALAFCMRHHAYHRKARELVQIGSLGRPVMARAQLTCWYPPIPGAWRQDVRLSGGGALIDMGTHCLDLLEWILGSPIRQVAAFEDQAIHRYATNVEDSSTVLLRFANGAHGIVDNYFNIPDAAAQNTLELHGTAGSILAQGTIGQEPSGRMHSILQSQARNYDASQSREPTATHQDYDLPRVGIYGQMVEAFCRCIREKTRPEVNLEDGRHSVKLVQAIYRAAKEGRVVDVV